MIPKLKRSKSDIEKLTFISLPNSVIKPYRPNLSKKVGFLEENPREGQTYRRLLSYTQNSHSPLRNLNGKNYHQSEIRDPESLNLLNSSECRQRSIKPTYLKSLEINLTTQVYLFKFQYEACKPEGYLVRSSLEVSPADC